MWELHHREGWMLKKWCFRTLMLEKTLESPLDCKEFTPVNPKENPEIHRKDWCWSWSSNTLATWCEELTHCKRPWFWERLQAGRAGGDRRWGGWMALPTQGTRVWTSSRRWWRKGEPGMLSSMRLQRVGHNLVTEQQPPEARVKKNSSLEPSEGAWPCWHLNFRLLGSRRRGWMSVVWNQLVCGNLLLSQGTSIPSFVVKDVHEFLDLLSCSSVFMWKYRVWKLLLLPFPFLQNL